MRTLALTIFGASALLSTAAVAAPLNSTTLGVQLIQPTEQVRLVCNEYGRCWRTRGPRYVERGYDDGYRVRRSHGYYGDGSRYYGGGPSIGFSFGNRGW